MLWHVACTPYAEAVKLRAEALFNVRRPSGSDCPCGSGLLAIFSTCHKFPSDMVDDIPCFQYSTQRQIVENFGISVAESQSILFNFRVNKGNVPS